MSRPSEPARDRVKSVPELAEIRARLEAEGKTVALAHGAFDLLHLGHVRHLERAANLADVLIVTVTADEYIRKGPGRPVFPDELRAEMLAALDCVLYTGVNHEAAAVTLLESLRPDVYVKGSDYANADDDPTGMISAEREIVEKHGGRIVFTDDVVLSSSNLINTHFLTRTPALRAFLSELRDSHREEPLLELIDRLSELRVLFIGETIVDEYVYVSPLGRTAKDSIFSTQFQDREIFGGGVIAAAKHAAGFCKEVMVLTCAGDTDEHGAEVQDNLPDNVRVETILLGGRPTIRKRRYVDSGTRESHTALRKFFEVAHIDDRPLDGSDKNHLKARIAALREEADVVVVYDFGHGFIDQETADMLSDTKVFLAVNAQSNSANMGFNLISKYRRANLMCIDEREARLAVRDKHTDIEQILEQRLVHDLDCDFFIITRGSIGSYCWDRNDGVVFVPALEQKPVDTMGAGDAFLAVTGPLLSLSDNVRDIGFIGNVVGGLKTTTVGHRTPINRGDIKKTITSLLK